MGSISNGGKTETSLLSSTPKGWGFGGMLQFSLSHLVEKPWVLCLFSISQSHIIVSHPPFSLCSYLPPSVDLRVQHIFFLSEGLLLTFTSDQIPSFFVCLRKTFFSPLLEDNYVGYRILFYWIFSFNTSNISLHPLLVCKFSKEKSNVIYTFVSL